MNKGFAPDIGLIKAQDSWRQALLGRQPFNKKHAVQCVYSEPGKDGLHWLLNNSYYFDIVYYCSARLVWINFPGFQIVGLISFEASSPLNPERYSETAWMECIKSVGDSIVLDQKEKLSALWDPQSEYYDWME